ncbi:MAG: formylmethanofuran dehydrogenase subunit C [Gammaproteobacteria bacterium]
MSALTFSLKNSPAQRVDLSPLVSRNLAGKSFREIGGLLLQAGKRKARVDELFDISGSDPQYIVIENSCGKLDFIGKGMEDGRLTVNGDAGAYLGLGMKSGDIAVNGDAGMFAACEMRGGFIQINGNAGDFLGSALPGNKQGMNGGRVLVKGNVGERAGDQMRRGTLLIEGDAGDYCGSRMIAGTIAVMGFVGRNPGFGMRRGTLLLWNKPELLPTFNNCGTSSMAFLPLLFSSFKSLDSRFAKDSEAFNYIERYGGDMAELGRGEILIKLQGT